MTSRYRGIIDVDAPEFSVQGDMENKITAFLRNTGQEAPQGEEDFYLCVLASLAMKYRQSIQEIELLNKKQFECISIVGGGSRNELLNKLAADICGKPVVVGAAEATSIGNLLCQLIALGEIGTDEAREVVKQSFNK